MTYAVGACALLNLRAMVHIDSTTSNENIDINAYIIYVWLWVCVQAPVPQSSGTSSMFSFLSSPATTASPPTDLPNFVRSP